MPLMPTSRSASFTSSSLNGLMMASTFFIEIHSPCRGRCLERLVEHNPCQGRAAMQKAAAAGNLPLKSANPEEMPNFHSIGTALKRTRPERFTGRTFQRIAIPAAEIGRGPVGAFEEGQQRRLRVGRCAHDLIGQQELAE